MKETFFGAVLVLWSSQLSGQPLLVEYSQTDVSRYQYPIALLEIALGRTEATDGPFELKPVSEGMSRERQVQSLKEGRFDVAWYPTTPEREEELLAIRIPILRGCLGYRVFLVHRDRLEEFAAIESLEEMNSQFVAGFGKQWADMRILEHNGLRVDGAVEYEILFKKLAQSRFDYFPRGINQAWKELEEKAGEYPDLAVEETLALYYPYPYYFFVSRDDTDLADRIRRGLLIAEEDGSFKSTFLEHYGGFLERADLSNRRVFRLDNPFLPPGTEEPDTSWWLKVE